MPEAVLDHKQLVKLHYDYEQAAAASGLRYVSDRQPGIVRKRTNTGFAYERQGKPVTDEALLERIKKLVIPPAWEQVWIAPQANAHIQATGIDVRGRKQYRYHPDWTALRNETKFHKMVEFGKSLPQLRLQMEEHMQLKGMPVEKVIATVLGVMERTYIRIGNSSYEKLYGSYGITTLKDKHVKVQGQEVIFCFTGKKGISHKISVRSRRLAKAVQACRDIPGRELFQYVDEQGAHRPVDSGMVNEYIRTHSGGAFSAKDFRTWAGSLRMLHAFMEQDIAELNSEAARKRAVVAALDAVSKHLGNTRTVCKKYYVHPGIIKLWEEDEIGHYLSQLDKIEEPDKVAGLTNDEQVLLKLLKKLQ